MSRSMSTSSSDSSHDSESPRKREASGIDDAMELDEPPVPEVHVMPCEHLKALETSPNILLNYQKALKWSGAGAYGRGLRRRKMQAPSCGTCETPLRRPALCLDCRFIGCWSKRHIQAHLNQHNHSLCADMLSGAIFCRPCDDFRPSYFQDLQSLGPSVPKVKETKSKRQEFHPWRPSEMENLELKKTALIPCDVRRGFLNLGSTCYMSVVLQAFLHNPLLRNYFLGDKHNSQLCGRTYCMCCELDQMFSSVFTPSIASPDLPTAAAFGPLSLLRTTWESTTDIAGYAQQDAHEFFIAVLNQLHSCSVGSSNGAACTCVVHQVFAGQLQSEVKCGKCGHVNPTTDPMLDISLELKDIQNGQKTTLASCLRRFTEQEKLPPKAYVCSNCQNSTSEATKQLSIKKLPPVLCIQLKRFEHKSSATKIDIPVQFPGILNMSPYTTATIGMQRDEIRSRLDSTAISEYELFAVINHEGQLNTGHYTNFAKSQSEWYRFDDEKVTHATLRECLNSVPYMCFYVKRQLEYGITPAPSTALIPVPIPLPLAPSRMEPATAGGSTVTPLPVPVAPIPAPTVNPSMMKALAMDDEDATSSRDSSPTSEQ